MILYDSNVTAEDALDSLMQCWESVEELPTEDEIIKEQNVLADIYFTDTEINLDKELESDIVCIADIHLWYGHRQGYRELSNNLKDVLCVVQGEYVQLYTDKYDLRMTDAHHDGTNAYTFRIWKEGTTEQQKENFLNKIYNQKATKADISRYTSSLKPIIKQIYGVC